MCSARPAASAKTPASRRPSEASSPPIREPNRQSKAAKTLPCADRFRHRLIAMVHPRVDFLCRVVGKRRLDLQGADGVSPCAGTLSDLAARTFLAVVKSRTDFPKALTAYLAFDSVLTGAVSKRRKEKPRPRCRRGSRPGSIEANYCAICAPKMCKDLVEGRTRHRDFT